MGCSICGNSDSTRTYRSEMNVKGISKCNVCDSISINTLDYAIRPGDYSTSEYSSYLLAKNLVGELRRFHNFLNELPKYFGKQKNSINHGEISILDVGAGDGEFVKISRNKGFYTEGIEISISAADICYEKTGIKLNVGDLDKIVLDRKFDVITLWCVLAHTDDMTSLLLAANRNLSNNGIIFISTPRYCAIDRIAELLILFRIRFGMKVLNRRVNGDHKRLLTEKGMIALAHKSNFNLIKFRKTCAYGLQASSYLENLRFPPKTILLLSKLIDWLIYLKLMPRNVLEVYLRK